MFLGKNSFLALLLHSAHCVNEVCRPVDVQNELRAVHKVRPQSGGLFSADILRSGGGQFSRFYADVLYGGP